MKRRLRYLLLTLALALPMFLSAFPATSHAILQPGTGQPSPGQQAIDELHSWLTDINQSCQSVNKASDSASWSRCEQEQNWLADLVGCSTTMFDNVGGSSPKGGGDVEQLNQSDFQDCQNKIKDNTTIARKTWAILSSVKNDCSQFADGSDQQSTCQGYEQSLAGISCDSNAPGDGLYQQGAVSAAKESPGAGIRSFQASRTGGGGGGGGGGSSTWTLKPQQFAKCQTYVNGIIDVAAANYCSGQKKYKGSELKACETGFAAQIKGQDQTKACSKYKGKDLAACNDGFGSAQPVGSVNGGSADSAQLGCDASSNPLSWIICPVINDLLVPAIELTDNIITQQMVVPAQDIFCSNNDTCAAYYSGWASFRDIALGLLAVAGLVVVIAQAIGMEILDAYTIRKVLPRILIAAIAITLSWTLMNFAVTLSNNLGFGVRELIVAPFHSLSSTINLSFSGSSVANIFGGAGIGLLVGTSIWIAAGGLGVLLSYIATAGLAVLVAILVLILRQIVIIMLILISPLALLTYVLPNTQRLFRLWWDVFSKTLLMFPLIAAFIASGRVFAAISLSNTSQNSINGAFHSLIGFVAYFAPYFMIPLTFRMSGGIISGLGNAINQRAQGVQGLLSNYRKGQAQSRIQRARAKGLYREGFGEFNRPFKKDKDGNPVKGSVGRMLNTVGFWGVNADEMIPMKLGTTTLGGMKKKPGIPGFRRGGNALMSQIRRANRDQTVKAAQDLDIGYKSGRLMSGQFQYYQDTLSPEKSQELNEKYGMFDKAGNLTGWRAPSNYGERTQVADIFSTAAGDKGLEAREAAGELRGTAAEFEKYTTNPETNRVDARFLGLLSAAKAGRLEIDDVTNNHNQLFNAGNQEDAVRETTLLQDALTQKRVSAARGHGIAYDDDGHAYNVYKGPNGKIGEGAFSDKAASSLARISNPELANIKSEDLDNEMAESWVANASEYDMKWDKAADNGKGAVVFDEDSGDYVAKRGLQAARSKQIRERLKTLAMYNQGDSDVGRKVEGIWRRIGGDAADLQWGAARGQRGDDPAASGAVLPDKPPEELPPP